MYSDMKFSPNTYISIFLLTEENVFNILLIIDILL